MDDMKHAFGLPEGTIRAILAILSILTCCLAIVYGLTIPDWFIAIAASIITHYFNKTKTA